MNEIRLRAYAKVNLGLDVLRRREDGYHDVRMVMQNVNIFDKVMIRKSNTNGICNTNGTCANGVSSANSDANRIAITTNLTYLPTDRSNLAYRAASLLIEEFGIDEGVYVDLYKFIPVSAGMAGGSADAAAVLYGMNRLFALGLSLEELMERGVRLGADIPYCLMGGTVLAEGIGEKLTRLKDCPDCFFVLAKPPFSVSTRTVYEKLVLDADTKHPDIDGIIAAIEQDDIYGVAARLENVLESVTATEYPDIERIKDTMRQKGALNALMSGSGPTVFGIFDDKDKAEECNNFLRQMSIVRSCYVADNCAGGFESHTER